MRRLCCPKKEGGLTMKKISIIFMVLSMMIGMTQCKKNIQCLPDRQVYHINIDVNRGSKVDVNTANGMVTFEEDDCLYVVSGGVYVGTLKHDGSGFSGDITGPVMDSPLYFYFLGTEPQKYLRAGISTSCTVSIENQVDRLPVVSCGISNREFTGEGSYSTFLYNKCALVKFNVTSDMSSEAVCIGRMNNYATIDFSTKQFDYSQKDGGVIKLSSGSGEKWAIVFPNEETLEASSLGAAFTADYSYQGECPAIRPIHANDFMDDGYDITIATPSVSDGMFTMDTGKRVIFAKGNLQYIGSATEPYWTFAAEQYDLMENTVEQTGGAAKVDRDRFGWGTGDYPNNVSACNNDYTEYVEWGKHFEPVDGHEWHAPKCVEWEYVMFTRSASKLNDVYNARFARAQIIKDNGDKVNGIILFPDVYEHPDGVALPTKSSINYTNNNHNASYTDNSYTVAEWDLLEEAGCVFLPAGGQRINKSGAVGFYDVNIEGHYWSQCDLGDLEHACNIYFTDYRPYIYDKNDKYKGFSVRLVHE